MRKDQSQVFKEKMIFHLAIPAKSLEDSIDFYKKLGAKFGRSSEIAQVMEFYGHQVVLHKSLNYDLKPSMYPRHFGVIMNSRDDFMGLWASWKDSGKVYSKLFVRYYGKLEEHQTFFLKDPSNNLVEFKWYVNQKAIFGK